MHEQKQDQGVLEPLSVGEYKSGTDMFYAIMEKAERGNDGEI